MYLERRNHDLFLKKDSNAFGKGLLVSTCAGRLGGKVARNQSVMAKMEGYGTK